MKDIKTKEVTTKPKTKNPASRIPKELMRTAILESKEKSMSKANTGIFRAKGPSASETVAPTAKLAQTALNA